VTRARSAAGGKRSRAQSGFTLVAAVFLVVVLSLLSAYLVGLRSYQDTGVSLDALGTRAHAASRAGAEWGAYNSLRNGACAPSTALALGGTLAGFAVTVTCSRSTHSEAESTVAVDTIVANACNQPAGGNCPNPAPAGYYVERQLTVMVAR
jgi:MSHA biogenesis protein MshP